MTLVTLVTPVTPVTLGILPKHNRLLSTFNSTHTSPDLRAPSPETLGRDRGFKGFKDIKDFNAFISTLNSQLSTLNFNPPSVSFNCAHLLFQA